MIANIFTAQSDKFDQRLLEKFSQNELEDMKLNSPDRFKTIVYCFS